MKQNLVLWDAWILCSQKRSITRNRISSRFNILDKENLRLAHCGILLLESLHSRLLIVCFLSLKSLSFFKSLSLLEFYTTALESWPGLYSFPCFKILHFVWDCTLKFRYMSGQNSFFSNMKLAATKQNRWL